MPARTVGMEEKKALVLVKLGEHCSAQHAASCVGVHRNTIYRWKDEDPEFAAAWDELIEARTDFVEDRLFDLIKKGHPTAIIFYLKTQGRNRGWIERQEVQVSGDETGGGFDWGRAIGAPQAGSVVDPARSRADKGSNGRAAVGQNGSRGSH